jgi:hypothetical protein
VVRPALPVSRVFRSFVFGIAAAGGAPRTHATVESPMLSGEKTSSEITIPFCTMAHATDLVPVSREISILKNSSEATVNVVHVFVVSPPSE